MFYYGFDIYFLIYVIPPMILAMWASYKVKSTFNKYSKVGNVKNLTAAEVTRSILNKNGLSNISVERVAGELTDHFDPRTNVIRLSDSVYSSNSVAAIGVAAHEAGHAVQHANGYAPIRIRNSFVPIANIASHAAMPLVFIGLILGLTGLASLGIWLFGAVVLFQIITLPVEFNASKRAIRVLDEYAILSPEENKGAKKVLTAAALTYIAATLVALGNLLRLLALSGGRRRN